MSIAYLYPIIYGFFYLTLYIFCVYAIVKVIALLWTTWS